MKLYIEDNEAIPAVQVLPDADPTPNGFTEKVSIADWDKYGVQGAGVKGLRDAYVNNFLAGWGAMSDAEKKALIRAHVWDAGATAEELDALYTEDQRDEFEDIVMNAHRKLGCVITPSTTPSSKKRIDWTADDLEVADPKTVEPHLIIQ